MRLTFGKSFTTTARSKDGVMVPKRRLAAVVVLAVLLPASLGASQGSAKSWLRTLSPGTKATPFKPYPYSVACVVSVFGASGTHLRNVLPGSGMKFGWVLLQPLRSSLYVRITVTASPRKAQALIVKASPGERVHPKQSRTLRATRDGNLFISYRSRLQERRLVSGALHRLAASGCTQ